MRWVNLIAITGVVWALAAASARLRPAAGAEPPDGATMKAVLDSQRMGENLLDPNEWQPYEEGFQRSGPWFVCDNGDQTDARRGLNQSVELNQASPAPIVATVSSKAEGVTGAPDSDYSLYLDLVYADGTPLWGQSARFSVGSHDWQQRQVLILPDKPVRRVTVHLLLRGHGGKAWFRDPELRAVQAPAGACLFDGVAVTAEGPRCEGFQIRDVAAESDFVHIDKRALGVELQWTATSGQNAELFDVVLTDTTGRDRAITLVYAVPVEPKGLRWLHDPRRSMSVESGGQYLNVGRFRVGANGQLSRYPLAAVTDGQRGVGLGIDPARPAFYRLGYNASVGELFLAFDIGLAPEKPSAKLRLCRFAFDPDWEFRSALARYYSLFPEAFRRRTPEQGLWMPFARISQVKGWEDFGFKFKEGDNETAWDDQHDIVTFRYTEPMTWWMRMPPDMPRTLEAALAEAKRLADKEGNARAQTLLASGYRNEAGEFVARFLDTPWCNGAVWSTNGLPGIDDPHSEFNSKWSAGIRERLYGPKRKADLDGEYIDSSEGYVTDELDFNRNHFAASDTPLCFSLDTRRVAVFRGLIVFEMVRAMARDVHGMDKLMMANSTPSRLFWLAPLLDVMGAETDWNRGGRWQPMSDSELLYRRAICKGKPFCFLMNTQFEQFSYELVEKYMKRALAYGMFPGFFSHNASQGHYFTRPELYDRDRPLFKKYVPLCKLVAEAGWTPIAEAWSSDEQVRLERFGDRWLTVFNDSPQRRTVTVRVAGDAPAEGRELVSGRTVSWREGKTSLTLDGEDVAVLQLK